jgi:hypothetical protein
MILATPLGLIALLAIPAIIAIHLFRQRFPVRPVAGLFLWQTAQKTPEGGARVSKLPITASLLLECLAALALALILAGARWSTASASHHLVVLLDDSASMAAVNTAGESARDRAVRRVFDELDRRSSGGRVTLVQSGERPSILAGPAVLDVQARTALQAWTPEAPHHALTTALRLVRELAGETGTIMVVSDVPPDARGIANFDGGLWVSVGEPVTNVGITAADRTGTPDRTGGTVSLTLVSNGSAPVRRRLTVSARDQDVAVRDVDVPPGASSLTLAIPAGLPAVRVRLSDDSLRRDDDVVLAEPQPRTVAVENRLPDGRGRSALVQALDALSGVTAAASGHLAFVESGEIEQAGPTDVWRIGFGRPPVAWVKGSGSEDYVGPFVAEKRHPLLLGVTLDGVVWSGAWPLAPNIVRPIVSTGDRVLMGQRVPAAGTPTTLILNLDLDRTNLLRSPDWPILISNVIEMRRQSLPGPERWNYRTGEWVRARLDRDPTGPLSFRCGSVERSLPASRQLEFIAPSPGGLLQILEGDQVLFEIGVNFLDEQETRLDGLATADTGELASAPGLRAESGAASDPLFWVLLVIGGTALLVNWCVLAPGRGSRATRLGGS